MLYLDFDGVLHHESVFWHPRRGAYVGAEAAQASRVLFEHAASLEEVLAPHPAVRIVLSTTWAIQYSFTGAARWLPAGLRERCIGSTWHSDMSGETEFARLGRPRQILADVQRRRPGAWLAIDDDCEGWPESLESHLVRSDPVHGISAPAVLQELREKLAGMQS